MSQEDTNEGNIAKEQLKKLKEKYKLSDQMIYPIYTKDVLTHDKTLTLNCSDEILYIKIGKACGNEVTSHEYSETFVISYSGNDITIKNSESLIEYINEYIDDLIESIYDTNLPTIKEIKKDNLKLGLVFKIIDEIEKKVEKPELVLDKQEKDISIENIENEDDVDSKESQENENNCILKRSEYNKQEVIESSKIINEFHLIPIIKYVKKIIYES